MAEWSNAAVLKTVDLNGSGGSNPSLSAKHKKKGVKFYLNAFFYCALQRPAAGGEGCRSAATKSLRERDSYCSLSSGLLCCKGPAASVQGCAKERSDCANPVGSKSLREGFFH